jgi:general secretion pathway protein G
MKSVRRKGFTLVELLIVIVIIGILAGAMMMLMGSSSDKAEATKVISDLRTMKGAVLQYYTDKSTYPDDDDVAALEAYIDKELTVAGGYSLLKGHAASPDLVFVGKQVPTAGAGEKVQETVVKDELIMWSSGTEGTLGTRITDTSTAPGENHWIYTQAN